MMRVLIPLSFVIILFSFDYVAKATSFIVFDEVLKTSKSKLTKVAEDFQKEIAKDKKIQGFIINYGTTKEIAKREKIIRDSIAFRNFDASRITLVRGGKEAEAKTRFLLVPNEMPPDFLKDKLIK